MCIRTAHAAMPPKSAARVLGGEGKAGRFEKAAFYVSWNIDLRDKYGRKLFECFFFVEVGKRPCSFLPVMTGGILTCTIVTMQPSEFPLHSTSYASKLYWRHDGNNILLLAGRLFQEYCCTV